MTYLNEFIRLVVIGRLYDVEDFSFSISMIGGTPLDVDDDVPGAVVTAVQSYFEHAQLISRNATLTAVKWNLIGEDGRYVNPNTRQHDFEPPVKGAVVNTPPPQVSLAISTVTGLQRGRASKGRWFLPLPGAQMTDEGRMSTSDQQVALNASRDFLVALNAAAGPWHAGVVSNVGTGAQHPITGVRVGRVFDTIRSRRDKFDEDYRTVPLT